MALNARLTRVLREVRRWRGQDDGAALAVDPELRSADWKRLSAEIEAVIDARGGLAAARRRARAVGLTYLTLSSEGRRRFFEHLAADHGRDRDDVDRAMDAVASADGPDARRAAEAELRRVLRPGHEVLLRSLAGQDGGLAFLVALRADLLPHRGDDPGLRMLDAELRTILENWFDVGLLELRRLTWDTPASFLEKLIEYEAVHAIESWDDLKHRLGPGRRCYAFVHPAIPDDPLIFVEVALTEGMSDSLGPLLDSIPLGDDDGDSQVDEDRADTAIFYSISNCHRGLAGVSLGDFLIKSVAEELSAELSGLKTFATLSPLPGLRAWLEARVEEGDGVLDAVGLDGGDGADAEAADPVDRLRALLDGPRREADDPELEELRPALLELVARYLTTVDERGRAIDPVAHFHLSNGARLERINWMANRGPVGWDRGLGLMVNYRYDLRTIEANHDRYVTEAVVPVADRVRRLLDAGGDGRSRRR